MMRWSPVTAILVVASASVAAAQPALLPAAGSFRELSEAAFAAPQPALDQAAERALVSMGRVRASLPPGESREVGTQLAALDAARRGGDRPRIALASAEVYRILVTFAGPQTKIPPEVRLLDYSRLRYQGALATAPLRWDDARGAVVYARARWAELSPRVTEGSLRLRVGDALDAMDSAAGDRSSPRADQAASDFQSVVSQLQAYFDTA